MLKLPFKLVRAILNLLIKILRRSVRLAMFVALVTGVIFLLDTFLLDSDPERKEEG